MTAHNPAEGIPTSRTESLKIDKPSNPFGRFFRSKAGKITAGALTVTTAAGVAAAIILPKEGGEAPVPATTNSAEPFPTQEPTAEATTTPEAPTSVFEGKVNYEQLLDNWANLDQAGKDAACAEFFAVNLPDSTPVSRTSTGPEVITWWSEHVDVINQLNIDESDERNHPTALNLASCITTVRESSADAQSELTNELKSIHGTSFDDIKPDRITEVTRYSDGLFIAQGSVGEAYEAIRIEGTLNVYGNPLVRETYAFNQSDVFPSYALSTRVSADAEVPATSEPLPPIVLDPSRANEPWKQ